MSECRVNITAAGRAAVENAPPAAWEGYISRMRMLVRTQPDSPHTESRRQAIDWALDMMGRARGANNDVD